MANLHTLTEVARAMCEKGRDREAGGRKKDRASDTGTERCRARKGSGNA